MSEFCFTLICPVEIEEQVLDALLSLPEINVFTSSATAAHGLSVERMNDIEQVLGRATAIQIQVLVTGPQKHVLLAMLHQQFAHTGLRYWVSALTESGEI